MYKRINTPLLKNRVALFEIGDTSNEIIGDATNWETVMRSIWHLEKGDAYWYVDNDGVVRDTRWCNDGTDRYRLEIGNVYLTREEAEEASWRMYFETKMRKEFKPEECNWNNLEQEKCCIYYNYFEEEIKINARGTSQTQGTIYCNNVETITQFIKDNEQDLLRYFGVKND